MKTNYFKISIILLLFLGSQAYAQEVIETEVVQKTPQQFFILNETPHQTQKQEEFILIREKNKKHHHPKTKIKINGEIDGQYNFSTAKDKRKEITKEDISRPIQDANFLGAPPSPKDFAGFQIRRARLGLDAQFKKGWSAHIGIGLDLTNIDTDYNNRRDYLDYAYVRKYIKYHWINGHLILGYKKVKFGLEEATKAFDLLTVERSIATNYFNGATLWDVGEGRPSGYVCTPLGVGNRHTGIQWLGKADGLMKGLNYYLALTNEVYNPFLRPSGQTTNRISYYGGIGYARKSRSYELDFGLNYAYSPKGIMYFPISDQGSYELMVFNPYMKARAGWLSMATELFIGHAEHGQFIVGGFLDDGAPGRAKNAPDAKSLGINAMLGIQLMKWVQPFFRYSYLDSGGAGFSSGYLKDVLPNANAGFENSNFDKGHGYTAGINFDVRPGKVRFSIEYQGNYFYDDLAYRIFINNTYTHDKVSNDRAIELIDDSEYFVNSLRARVQIRF